NDERQYNEHNGEMKDQGMKPPNHQQVYRNAVGPERRQRCKDYGNTEGCCDNGGPNAFMLPQSTQYLICSIYPSARSPSRQNACLRSRAVAKALRLNVLGLQHRQVKVSQRRILFVNEVLPCLELATRLSGNDDGYIARRMAVAVA